jgi:hypothetical protein
VRIIEENRKKAIFLQKNEKYERIRGMKYNCKNYIRVLYEVGDIDRPNADTKRLIETQSQNERFKKRTTEWITGFFKSAEDGNTQSYLRQELQKLENL